MDNINTMKHLLLSAMALAALQAHAQPTLTYATNAPALGSAYTLNYSAYQAPGAAGANVTWDFFGLSVDSSHVLQFVQPGATPDGSSFPGSNLAQVGGSATMYFQVAPTGVSLAGSVSDGLVVPYTDMGLYLPFPCTYQTSWNDTEGASFNADGTPVTRTGTAVGEADGYGTLVMPNGATVPNVLRVHWTETIQDVTPLFTIDMTFDSHLYYATGTGYPLVQVVTATVSFGGVPQVVQFTQWVQGITTGVLDKVHHGPLQVYPNPATDQLTLRDASGEFTVCLLYDATGRVVRTQSLVAGRAVVDVGDLPRGLYIAEFRGAGEARRAERVQVQ